jgi:acetolactate synthase I/II/III large subunit
VSPEQPAKRPPVKKSGAEILVESLIREKVTHLFGYPGGVILGVYDVLFSSPLQHIFVRHEQGGVHAADGYARASGRPGVALVTSGPGATNAVTGIATAYMDSIPLVVLTGQVPTQLIGNDAFQEADIVGITRPCVKHSYLVKDVRDLAGTIQEAFFIATTGRPGPVLVDLPKDVLAAKTEPHWLDKIELRSYNPTYKGHPKQIQRAAEMLADAARPILLVGGGVIGSNAAAEVLDLAAAASAPVTCTLMGLGGFPGTHELSLGMLGMHGTYAANMAISHADLILALGARFDDRVTGKVDEFATGAKIVQIDIDPTSISKNVRAHLPIVGDVKNVLRDLLPHLRPGAIDWQAKHQPWLSQVRAWAAEQPLAYKTDTKSIKPQYVVEKIWELTRGEAIICTEVGQNQMWTAQFYKFAHPRSFITSGGLGTMGFGFPAAIGAQVAFPDRLVIDVAGDGSIQMNIQEMMTAVQYRLPVKVVILNNGFLGMVRQWQELFFDKRYSSTCLSCAPDFVKLAEAYGATGLRATRTEEVVPTLERAFATPGPVMVDVRVSPEENVYPMVPAGASLKKMILI